METIKILEIIIGVLVILLYIVCQSSIKKSREIKRLYLNNRLRAALNEKDCLNFGDYSLEALEFFKTEINDFFIRSFEKRIEDVTYLINSIDKIKNKPAQDYLKNLLNAAVNDVEVKKLAKLVFTNMFDYLHFIKNKKFKLSSYQIEAESARYFKFNSFILIQLSDTKCLELIGDIHGLIEEYKIPDFSGNESMKKWFREEMPILLKAELAKIKMYSEE